MGSKKPLGIPFPAPALPSDGGTMKRYLTEDVMKWEQECSNLEVEQKAI
jgi:hypothetical protein